MLRSALVCAVSFWFLMIEALRSTFMANIVSLSFPDTLRTCKQNINVTMLFNSVVYENMGKNKIYQSLWFMKQLTTFKVTISILFCYYLSIPSFIFSNILLTFGGITWKTLP